MGFSTSYWAPDYWAISFITYSPRILGELMLLCLRFLISKMVIKMMPILYGSGENLLISSYKGIFMYVIISNMQVLNNRN